MKLAFAESLSASDLSKAIKSSVYIMIDQFPKVS